MSKKIRVLFELVQEYYWPAMKPVYEQFASDSRYECSIKVGFNHTRFLGIFLIRQKGKIEQKFRDLGFTITNETSGFDLVICGDTLKYPEIYGDAILCNVDHGPCTKSLRYRNLLKQPNTKYVVCAEGPYRMQKLKEYGLDQSEIVRDVGLPKLDPFFTGGYSRKTIEERHNLDPKKPIVLYAPTYKPTSIFEVVTTIGNLTNDYNVVVKLHPYSWSGKYAPHKQHRVFEALAKKNPAVVLVSPKEHDIMPYLFAADTMISEGSSVINEFLALGRCGIIFDMDDDNQKHSDGEPLLVEKSTEWLKDSFIHISHADQLADAVYNAVHLSPERKIALEKDRNWIYSCTDGTAASKVKAVCEELLSEKEKF